jgi:hypothetical protein
MRLIISTGVALALLGFSGFASAAPQAGAELTQITGDVLVDTGNGFVPVSGTSQVSLKIGDRVMVAKGGSAVLSLGADCSVPLQSPSMTTVAESACVVGTQDGETGEATGTGGGAVVFAATAGTTVGSLGTIAAQAVLDDDDDEEPMSP